MTTGSDRKAKGKAMARKLLAGSTSADIGRVPERFVRYSVEHLFGDVWQGDDLTLEERELVTCTILVALNREAELRIHFNAAKNLGLPRTRIEGMITHAAHYAGWPVAASGFRILNEVWPEGSSGTGKA
jgi:4-carboxymuconolactone decarboxylase